jgi:phage shock protein A
MSFQDAVRVLANQQKATEQQIEQFRDRAGALKPAIHAAIEEGRFDEAQTLLRQATTFENQAREQEEALERCCSMCGSRLVPHSFSWLEGFHLDGCCD